jgi:acyl-CoA thioester hydrolase
MSGYFEIYRGIVNAWECDIMGHLNVQFYTGKASEGMGHLRAACGMTPSYIRADRQTMVAVSSLSRYVRELHAGEVLVIEAAIMGVGERSVDLVLDIMNAETGLLSCSFDLTCASFDLETRRAKPWPDDMRAQLNDMVAPRRDDPRPATTGGAGIAEPAGGFAKPFVSSRGSVMSWECDEFGHMSARFFMARAADAIGHVKERIGFSRSLTRELNWGSAALEYTIDYRREMIAGDIYTMRSGLIDVDRKTFRFGHVLSEDCSGEICATFDAIGCMFDLKARKAMEIPADLRDQAAGFIIEWPQPSTLRQAAE